MSSGIELLGWGATAVFVASYLARREATLVRVQLAGALLWVGYGLLAGAAPVVAANLLVMAAAAWKAFRPGARAEPGAAVAPR